VPSKPRTLSIKNQSVRQPASGTRRLCATGRGAAQPHGIIPQEEIMTTYSQTERRQGRTAGRPLLADPDVDSREGLNARRNVLFGLWAARRIGLSAEEQDAFAWNVHFADLSEPGHDDVVDVVARAFKEHGVPMSDRALRSQLREMTLRALYDLSVEERRR
jgi:hypothetical protein